MRSTQALGTLAVAAPSRPTRRQYRPQADVWALGPFVFYMLTGKCTGFLPGRRSESVRVLEGANRRRDRPGRCARQASMRTVSTRRVRRVFGSCVTRHARFRRGIAYARLAPMLTGSSEPIGAQTRGGPRQFPSGVEGPSVSRGCQHSRPPPERQLNRRIRAAMRLHFRFFVVAVAWTATRTGTPSGRDSGNVPGADPAVACDRYDRCVPPSPWPGLRTARSQRRPVRQASSSPSAVFHLCGANVRRFSRNGSKTPAVCCAPCGRFSESRPGAKPWMAQSTSP